MECQRYSAMFDVLEADIVVFQETKIQKKDLRDDMVLVPGWDCYFSLPKVKKGYSGVVIYTRNATCAPIRAEEGITGILCPPNSSTSFRDLPPDQQIGGYPTKEQLSEIEVDPATLDSEGRCVILEFPAFVLLGVYSPANRDETRDGFRLAFVSALDARVRNLVAMGKRVILAGDLNIAKGEIDSAHLAEAIRKGTATEDDFISNPVRRIFNQLVSDGRVIGEKDPGRELPVLHDICRAFHPDRRGMYTCWEQRINARPGNYGARIDYVLCSLDMQDWLLDSNIQEGLMGSDHCPVYAVFKDKVPLDGTEVDIRDIVNPPGMFKNGERQREYSTKDLLPLSGRLIPEFDRRRNIKDMFFRKSSVGNSAPPALSKSDSQSSSVASTSAIDDGVSVGKSAPNNSVPEQDSEARPASTPKRPQKRESFAPPPAKRAKSTGASTKGQQSLIGFLKPKRATDDTKTAEDSSQNAGINATSTSSQAPSESSASSNTIPGPPSQLPANTSSDPTVESEVPTTGTPTEAAQDELIVDPIASKESWSKLFTKKAAPKCEGHQEPCIMLTTKKPGINCGRAFWICPRPIGPSGNKEKGTQWRCSTFIWASDWNGPG
ncbi:Exodeoxyribonuclease III [Rasamsonia emersonii CBS 393.64]|uniref:DNA-(apurinic or apyrimidinic site) endonuclease 2 n=1 Tax=Rasamsonia emersonii (strain ATCC 16479 / CBS 393.64 / IMI 116815) TaxID=1408163 RepID=A0A0F4YHM8_RASE3|nr:Exodeoxyribonuclease III [Rasamsonia emersonii CBS 393.64]KKA17123.1 Exodeoxyribonuclease III [Rasamsonia emersonii CBS 393.64]